MKAMLDRAKKLSLGEIIQLAIGFLSNIKTNVSIGEIMELIPFAFDFDPNDLVECTVPFDGTFSSGMMGGVWKIMPDFEKNREMLHEFIYEN